MSTVIVIPARFASTRFPGKPLVKIAGKEMLLRVFENAQKASANFPDIKIIIATEDERIKSFCDEKQIECVITSDACKTGTDRVLETIDKLGLNPDFVINLQGDNPMCPPWFIEDMLNEYKKDNSIEVLTPCVNLDWDELETLREHKKVTPFSGTTCTFDKNNDALWFSKNIIPAIRKEPELKEKDKKSPIYRHIGLYGYKYNVLKQFALTSEGYYEKLEGLEQLRFLENGIKVRIVKVDYKGYGSMSGVDSPEDVERAEALLLKQGEF